MFGHLIIAASDWLYELLNQATGHFWLLDNLLALTLHNSLVKAAFLGGCFLAAWYTHHDETSAVPTRRILLVTLLASGVVVVTTRVISTHVFHPRPFVYSQETYHLEGSRLVESRHLPYRVPLESASQKKYRGLLQGELASNDLDAFPSDHAAFYITIAAGIMLAVPAIGRFAMAWTILVILVGRMVTGQHSPLDIVAGAAIGAFILFVCQAVFGGWLRWSVDWLARWTLRHQAVATALVFIALFEVSNTLQDLNALIETGSAVARYFRAG
ncbi:MAG TPA: phosphatase PAP2 family protein [Candidatus Krumholzibacteria bacterium]|nr:phosphatase PAP2 family protein [Candidatus Krumholzibacteria bacterium]